MATEITNPKMYIYTSIIKKSDNEFITFILNYSEETKQIVTMHRSNTNKVNAEKSRENFLKSALVICEQIKGDLIIKDIDLKEIKEFLLSILGNELEVYKTLKENNIV